MFMASIEIIQGDITKLQIDAIVNAANHTLLGGGGVDGAIHRAAGPELLEECKTLEGCKTGEAKITKGYNLHAKYVIHTVGPIYGREKGKEDDLLADCYKNCLKLAVENSIKTIAFPAISTGVYGFPKDKAAKIVYQTVKVFIKNNKKIEKVIFVLFSEKDIQIFKEAIK